MPIADELEKLERLRSKGSLSEAEFQEAKSRALREESDFVTNISASGLIFGMTEKTWCLLMHLSQLLNVAPGAGIVAPIVMWALSKDRSLEADRHGRIIINWLISSCIYFLVTGILSMVFIGIPFLVAVALLTIIFPIVGAVKANDGILWQYPLSIQFMESEPM